MFLFKIVLFPKINKFKVFDLAQKLLKNSAATLRLLILRMEVLIKLICMGYFILGVLMAKGSSVMIRTPI